MPLALAVASVGLSAYGAYSQSKSAKASAAYQRDVAKTNEKIAEQNARDVELRGRQAIYDQQRQVARSLSSVRAATTANNLEVGVAGTTPQDLVQAMAEAGALDVMRLRNNVDREKRRAEIQGMNYAAQAGQFELERRSISPFRSALITGVGAATSGASGDILFGSLGGN